MRQATALLVVALATASAPPLAADDSVDLATAIIRDACLPTAPAFEKALGRAVSAGLVQDRDGTTGTNHDLKVAMTVQPAQSYFGIPIEPLCVVSVLDRDGADLYDAATRLAFQISPDASQSGDAGSIADDALDWEFRHNGMDVMMSLQEDSHLFTRYAILSLTTVTDE